MRVKTWRIIDRGSIPLNARTIPFSCRCGHEAQLPVVGRVLAVTGEGDRDSGIVFDNEAHAIPPVIQCRKCGNVMEDASVR